MKLYYTKGSCSLTSHILLCESGLDFSIESVNLREKLTESGKSFLEVTKRGQVPALELSDGSVLTENIAIAQYLSDQVPEKHLLAPVGKIERYQAIAWFNYIATEIHKRYGPLFAPMGKEAFDFSAKILIEKYHYIDEVLSNNTYLLGEHFTIADAYLFVTTRWNVKIPNRPTYPAIDRFMEKMNDRLSVKQAIEQEKQS